MARIEISTNIDLIENISPLEYYEACSDTERKELLDILLEKREGTTIDEIKLYANATKIAKNCHKLSISELETIENIAKYL